MIDMTRVGVGRCPITCREIPVAFDTLRSGPEKAFTRNRSEGREKGPRLHMSREKQFFGIGAASDGKSVIHLYSGLSRERLSEHHLLLRG